MCIRDRFWWGGWISANQANYNSSGGYTGAGRADWLRMARADAFEANSWGLYNVHGNVWEWVQDCWHKGYKGAPNTGRAWETGCTTAAPYQSPGTRTDGPSRVLRGGSLLDEPRELRVTGRMVTGPDDRDNSSGFRIARTP